MSERSEGNDHVAFEISLCIYIYSASCNIYTPLMYTVQVHKILYKVKPYQ